MTLFRRVAWYLDRRRRRRAFAKATGFHPWRWDERNTIRSAEAQRWAYTDRPLPRDES